MADSPQHAHQALAHTAAFDLSDALRGWRANLSGSPAFRPDDLEELESHVRDSIASLEAAGLSTREAFWVATSRVGTADALDREFGKVNTDRVWLDRALWMVAGSLGIQAVVSLVSWVATLIVVGASQVTGRPAVLGLLGFAAYVAVTLVAFVALWRSGSRGQGVTWRFAAWVTAHPVAAAVLVAVFFAFNTVSSMLTASLAVAVMPWSTYASTLQWRWLSVVLPVVFWPAVLAWLLKRAARMAISE